VSNNVQLEMKAKKSKKLKSLGKEKCFQLAFKDVNGIYSTKW